MKVYALVHYKDNHPLYICLSQKVAEQLMETMDIDCYLQELPLVTADATPINSHDFAHN